MRKKIVFLPYDFDTAIGINNEGALVFGYDLEDIDTTEGGADVFNGQQSVLWKNMRTAFFDEMKAMYQRLRSTGALSYEKVERMFEEHQGKWPEAVFNEDAWFKYLAPLVEKGNASYLSMLQGSKAEQRKWWLYNRFRYIDSKYNAGDSLSDVITLRGYAKDNITVQPYADVYVSVKYGSYLVQERSARNTRTTLTCPLDSVNDTEIYIYSASQLADVGDLSGLKVGYADFSKAAKLQRLKLGDGSAEYANGNLTELYLGNNELLRTIDIRNCPAMTQAVDLSGCGNLEHIFFDGTSVTGLELPEGGVIKTLHLPETVTSLSVIGHPGITDFSLAGTSNLTTLRLENTGGIDSLELVNSIPSGCRVRLVGFDWTVENDAALSDLKTTLDTMRGLSENGGNEETAQLDGAIHIDSITGATLKEFKDSYPDVKILYQHITSKCYYYNYDGTVLLYTATALENGNVNFSGSTPTKPSTAAKNFTFKGWAREIGGECDPTAQSKVVEDRYLYAVFTASVRTYTVKFCVGSTVLQTKTNVPYGGSVYYDGEVPRNTAADDPDDYEFSGWDRLAENIQGNVTCKAQFNYIGLSYKHFLDGTISGDYVNNRVTSVGDYGFYNLDSLTSVSLPNATYTGRMAFGSDSYSGYKLTSISLPNLRTTADYAFYTVRSLKTIEIGNLETLGQRAFYGCSALTSIRIPKVGVISDYAFSGCSVLASADISGATAIKSNAFYYCRMLSELTIAATVTEVGSYAFQHCESLKTVCFMGKPAIYSNAFYQCTGIEDIYVSWNYNEVGGAPWGAENATIHYLGEGWKDTLFPSGN